MAAISLMPPSNVFSWVFSWIKMLKFRLKFQFVPKGPINNISVLVQIMAWNRAGKMPLSEPMLVNLLAHIHVCITRPYWVKACVCQWVTIHSTELRFSDDVGTVWLCIWHCRRNVVKWQPDCVCHVRGLQRRMQSGQWRSLCHETAV